MQDRNDLQRGRFGIDQLERDVLTDAGSLLALFSAKAALASIGECQEEEPYASVRYIFKDGKRFMCCTHDKPHCFEVK